MRKPLFQSSSRHDKRKISKNLLKYQNSLNEDLQNVVNDEKLKMSQEVKEVRVKSKMLKNRSNDEVDINTKTKT